MGDMVVQNSSQLHWGVNLAPGAKAESSNCAGSDFMSLCPECSDGLYCGAQAELLKNVFHQARKVCNRSSHCSHRAVAMPEAHAGKAWPL